MMENIRAAIRAEIKAANAELMKLEKIMALLDDSSAPGVGSGLTTGKKRGPKSKTKKAATSVADLAKALEHIKAAGKAGIKAIKLSYALKADGHALPNKLAILEGGNVSMKGKGGGSTYVFKD